MRSSFAWNQLGRERKSRLLDVPSLAGDPETPVHLTLVLDRGDDPEAALDAWAAPLDRLAAAGLRSVSLVGCHDADSRFLERLLDRLGGLGLGLDRMELPLRCLDGDGLERCRGLGLAELVVFDVDLESDLEGADGFPPESRPGPQVRLRMSLHRKNYFRVGEMAALGARLGVTAVDLHLAGRAETDWPLAPEHLKAVLPFLEEALAKEPGRGLLKPHFEHPRWRDALHEIDGPDLGLAPSELAGAPCVMAGFTTTLDAGLEIYPCPKLVGRIRSLGRDDPVAAWSDRPYRRWRRAMSDLFLAKGRLLVAPPVSPTCRVAGLCRLKRRPWEKDEGFESGLEEARSRGWAALGAFARAALALRILAFRYYHGLRVRITPAALGLQRDWVLLRRCRFQMFRWLSLRRKIRRFAREPNLRLHVGCGRERFDGWVNIDLKELPSVDLALDVTRGLPFSGARLVFAEHFLEHLDLPDALTFLEEAHRALEPGGWIRLSTPNLDWIIDTHYRGRAEFEERKASALSLNRAFRGWEHRFLWNREMLEEALLACGFAELRFCAYGESEIESLRGLERHETYPDTESHRHVLIVEAQRSVPQSDRLRRLREHIEWELLDQLEG